MATHRFYVVPALAVMLLTGCGDSSPTDAGGTDAGTVRDAGPVPAMSCGQPGDTGNENGVGAFCTPGGNECRPHPLASLCIVDLDPVDEQWYCTRLCAHDSDCGSGAVCGGDSRGSACIPARCAPPRDGGVDAGATDASATDAGATDAGPSDTDASADASTSG